MTDAEKMREAAAKIVTNYDAMNPMRTGDFHAPDCQCLRCAIDLFRALADYGIGADNKEAGA